MPLHSRAHSSDPEFVLIAAPSGRALAQAARAAGYVPLVADFFDDLDTRELAEANCIVGGDLTYGFDVASLMTALVTLSEDRPVAGLIYGAGFEDRPELLDAFAERWPLLGNSASSVAKVKDPAGLSELCARLGIKHPEVSFETPIGEAHNWLIKQAGGSGGIHVSISSNATLASGEYYQRRVAGSPVSCLVLADGTSAIALGFSEQWASPAPGQPWRFGGCARPASLGPQLSTTLECAALALIEAAHLTGLNSVDFLVDGADFHLIEINPRPGATLDIFHDRDARLLRAHIEACQGTLPREALRFEAAEATAFVYAPFSIAEMPVWDWPAWTADRQKPGSSVAIDEPLCTVLASAPDLATARRLLDERIAEILSLVSKTNLKKEALA